MILYGSSLSPFVRKVIAFAAEKQIELDIRPVGIGDPDPGFGAASPFRKMPALDDDGYMLADSSAIIHYLEAKQPEPALIPGDPKQRGRTIWFDEFGDTILCACGAAIFFNRVVAPRFLKRDGDLAAADKAERETLPPLIDYLEGQIPDSGFLVGDHLTLADISVASPFANLEHCGIGIDSARHPKVARFVADILARPSFTESVAREAAFLARDA
ncbi:MAG TPA: glutathione S-transferase family protein [Sphingomicrobium sp.]|nr:glutathione S-transferase family protein [Sphingomicrobium sp.]